MRKIQAVIVLMGLLAMVGCSSSVESVKKTDPNTPVQEEPDTGGSVIVEEEEKEDPQEATAYTIGDRIVFDDAYALTILSVKETEERNEFSENEVAQVLIVEYLYENLNSDEEIYISDMEFKMVDEGGNMMDSYPVEAGFSPEYTPKGAKTLASFAVGTTEPSTNVTFHYYDNFFSSSADCVFTLPVGGETAFSMDGKMPTYHNMFSLGETVEITTEEGVYTLTVDSVKKTSERNSFETKEPEAVYEIAYSYSNVSMEETVYISEYSFTLIDAHGNTGYIYPNSSDVYPSETVKGAKSKGVMFFGTHKDSSSIILAFKDNMFNTNSDFYIRIDDIQ